MIYATYDNSGDTAKPRTSYVRRTLGEMRVNNRSFSPTLNG